MSRPNNEFILRSLSERAYQLVKLISARAIRSRGSLSGLMTNYTLQQASNISMEGLMGPERIFFARRSLYNRVFLVGSVNWKTSSTVPPVCFDLQFFQPLRF